MEKVALEWAVAIRGEEDLVRVAEVDTKGRAQVLADTLTENGVDAIYYRIKVEC